MGDDLFGAYRTILIEDGVANAVKRIQKLSSATKAVVGKTSRGDSSTGPRGAWRRGGSSFNEVGRSIATTTTCLDNQLLRADSTMEPLATMRAVVMAKTTDIVLV